LVNETNLYYDAPSEKHQIMNLCTLLFVIAVTPLWPKLVMALV